MPNKKIIIKADDYRYPTREERKKIYDVEPSIGNFGFKQVNTLVAVLNDFKDAAQAHKESSLHWWDMSLQFRLRNLSEAYINSLVHYDRGIPDDLKDFVDHQYINRMQFDYFAESYYYLFATVRDNIGQILNVFYTLKIDETKIHFNKPFAKKIPDGGVQQIIETFIDNTEQTMLWRNSFTHRYMPNQPDNRERFEEDKGQASFYSSRGEFVTTSKFRNNIIESQREMANLINDLRPILLK